MSARLGSLAFPRVDVPVVAQFWLTPVGVFDESDDPRVGTGMIALPRLG
jgi:hypothetical protein